MRVVPGLWNHDIVDLWIAGGPGLGLLLDDAKAYNVVLTMRDKQWLGDPIVGFSMQAVHGRGPDREKLPFRELSVNIANVMAHLRGHAENTGSQPFEQAIRQPPEDERRQVHDRANEPGVIERQTSTVDSHQGLDPVWVTKSNFLAHVAAHRVPDQSSLLIAQPIEQRQQILHGGWQRKGTSR